MTIKLYPTSKPFNSGYLQVSKLHKIYYEEVGNPKGKPILFLHGGPGTGTKPKYRKLFNPRKYRAILFSQRGCPKSEPLGEIRENTTWDLVDDIEKLRKHLGIDKWIIFAGSWGSTLGLAYAESHPKHVSGLILRGIWLNRQKDTDWYFKEGSNRVFPDFWEETQEYMKKYKSKDPIDLLYKKLTKETKKEQIEATIVTYNFEMNISTLLPLNQIYTKNNIKEEDIAGSRILMHYVKNKAFLTEDQLIKNAHKLKNIPMVLIHGRYDMIAPLDNAWALHKALPHSKLEIVEAAGHHSSEEGLMKKMIEYADKFC